jgi:TonB family protein
LRPYLIKTFRKIYSDIFKDNKFRKDYQNFGDIANYELEQLILNIFTLSSPQSFCNMLRLIIKEHATYIPSENDRFNLYGDDIIVRKKFSNKEIFDPVEIVKILFDNITFTDRISTNPETRVLVVTNSEGLILSRKITQSSGIKAWDEAVLRAIDKTVRLPKDENGRMPDDGFNIAFRPKDN